jgi:hypothetical protein
LGADRPSWVSRTVAKSFHSLTEDAEFPVLFCSFHQAMQEQCSIPSTVDGIGQLIGHHTSIAVTEMTAMVVGNG